MSNLRAALILTLEDKLSSGLKRLKGEFDQLRRLGDRLGLGKLQNAARPLREVSREAAGLSRNLRGVAAAADRAWARMRQMASGPVNRIRRAFGAQSRLGAFAGAAEGYSVVAPIRTYADFQDIALRAAITEGLSGAAAARESNRLMAFFRRDARDTGQSSVSVAEAFLDLIQTGISAREARALLPIHSRAATAYGIDPEALGHAVFALADTLRIGEHQMGGALAAMALAAQKGRFKIEDFSRYLPGLAGNAAKLGMTGRSSANVLFAMLETVMRNSSDSGQGATNFTDFMNYLTSPMAARSFALESRGMAPQTRALLRRYHIAGIDMPALLADARHKGMNPLEAVLGVLQQKLRGLPPDVMAQVLGAFFRNQQARDAAVALLLHSGEYLGLKHQLGGAQEGKLDADFRTRMGGAAVQTKQFSEALRELGQTLGRAFLPILLVVDRGLEWLLNALDWLDARFPGVENGVLLLVGAMLSLGAVASAIGFVWPVLSSGFSLLGGALQLLVMPLGWALRAFWVLMEALTAIAGVSAGVVAAIVAVAAVLAAAAIDIYDDWSTFARFFSQMWEGIKDIFGGFAEFLFGVFTGDVGMAWDGIKRIFAGLASYTAALWQVVKHLFADFTAWVDRWTGGAMTVAIDGIKRAWHGLIGWFGRLWREIRHPFDEFVAYVMHSPIGRLLSLADAKQLQPPGARHGGAAPTYSDLPNPLGAGLMGAVPLVRGHISVGVDPNNGQVHVRTHSHGSAVPLHSAAPDAGQVLGRP